LALEVEIDMAMADADEQTAMGLSVAETDETIEQRQAAAYLVVAAILGALLLGSLIWLIGELIYFTRPHVVAAFAAPARIGNGDPPIKPLAPAAGQPYSRDESFLFQLGSLIAVLMKQHWFRVTLQVATVLTYLVCLIMFFSFTASGGGAGDKAESHFRVGQPSPWLNIDSHALGFNWSISLVTWSNLTALVGLAALAINRAVEKYEKGRAHSMIWHYAIWGTMFLLVAALGVTNGMLIMGR
jgi:hypothetical protein